MVVGWARSAWSYAGRVSNATGPSTSGGLGEPGDAGQEWPGRNLGFPQDGPGSVAGRGVRLGALVIDLALMGLVTSLFVPVDLNQPEQMQQFNYISVLVWYVITVAMVGLFGFTAGKLLLGLRVVRVDGIVMVNPLRAMLRTLLLAVIVPAALVDADGRGLHDKITGTVVVRTR
jgi:uncharacterized RDD family membrane protein YckC